MAATRVGVWAQSLALIGLVMLAPRLGHGQQVATFLEPSIASPAGSPLPDERPLTWRWPPDSSEKPRTHWREGAVIGGVVIGFLGAVTGVGLCHFDDPCDHPAPFAVAGLLLGGLAGVGLGGHIGAAFPKSRLR